LLDQLFGASVKQTDMRIDARDDFAVQFKDEPQHTVGSGMLRPKVDGEVTQILRLFIHGQAFGSVAFSSPGSG
jgi:hypothetical protein